MYTVWATRSTSARASRIAERMDDPNLACALADLAVTAGYTRAQVYHHEPSHNYTGMLEYDTADLAGPEPRCPKCGWEERSCQGRCTPRRDLAAVENS